MNPQQPSREQIELRITALLLGELPSAEAELLRYAIAQDPALKKLRDDLAVTLTLVREIEKKSAMEPSAKSAPLKLSNARREMLLTHFKSPRQKAKPVEELFWLKPIAFPQVPRLVELLVVVAIVAVVAAMLMPSLAAAKRKAMRIQTLAAEKQVKQSEANLPMTTEMPGTSVISVPTDVTIAPAPIIAPPVQIVLPETETAPEVAVASVAPVTRTISGQAAFQQRQMELEKKAPTSLPAVTPLPEMALAGSLQSDGFNASVTNGVYFVGDSFSTRDRRIAGVAARPGGGGGAGGGGGDIGQSLQVPIQSQLQVRGLSSPDLGV